MSTPLQSTKFLLRKRQIAPLRRLGQNFLTDKFAVKRVVEAADLDPKDVVLEVGPGSGILTRELAKRAGEVVAVEKDHRMINVLKEALKDFRNVKVIHGDILKLNPIPYVLNSYKTVSNLPFYLAAPVIRKFLEAEKRPELMVFIVQKEVAQRICARPPKMNLLAVSIQFYANPKIIAYIPQTSFWPKPRVDSAIIKFGIKNSKFKIEPELFFRIVRAGFSQPRKQLLNNLSNVLKLDKDKTRQWLLSCGIDPQSRTQSLTLEKWIELSKNCIIK